MTHETRLTITLTPRTALLALLMTLVLSAPLDLGSETMTMTTTYPSPVGIYKTMVTTSNADLARDATNAAVTIGKNNGANLNVGGSVGIGMLNPPGARLDVNGASVLRGSAEITSGNFKIDNGVSLLVGDLGTGTQPQNQQVLGFDSSLNRVVWLNPSGNVGTIACSASYNPASGDQCVTHKFTASECGGTLPDSTYYGVFNEYYCCGELKNFIALNAGEQYDCTANGGPVVKGPGVAGWDQNLCGGCNARVLYIKTSGSGGSGTGTGGGGPGTGGSGGQVSGGLYGYCRESNGYCYSPPDPVIAPGTCVPIAPGTVGTCQCLSTYTKVALGEIPGSGMTQGSTPTYDYYSCMKN